MNTSRGVESVDDRDLEHSIVVHGAANAARVVGYSICISLLPMGLVHCFTLSMVDDEVPLTLVT